MQSPRQQTAKLRADLIDLAHREAGQRRAAGDRKASASSVLNEWAELGAAAARNAPKNAA